MLPLLLFLLLVTIDGGQFVNGYQVVSNACREGARVAVRTTTISGTEVEDSVMDYMYGAYSNVSRATLDSAMTIQVMDASGTPVEPAAVPVGAEVRVRVSLEFDAVRAIPGLDELDDRSIEATAIMRRE